MQNQVLNCDDMSELMKVLSGASEKWKITKIKGYGALNWVLLGFLGDWKEGVWPNKGVEIDNS